MSTTRDSIHVLHVDDEPDFADMVADFLESREGAIHVRTATEFGSASALLDEIEFDCIISDYDMPRYNGLEFLEKVREERPDIPFILYTGKGSEDIASEAISAGVTDYLQKGGGTEQYTILANRIVNAIDRTRSDREVERTREYFSSILNQASDYVMIVGEDGQIEYISPAVKRVMGFSPEELMESDAFEYTHPDDQSKAVAAFLELFENPAEDNTVEFRAQHADGSWRWLEVRGRNLLEDPVIEGVMVNVRDITERKERSKQLQRYEYAYESSMSGIAIASPDGEVIDVNSAALDMWGYDDKEAVIGRSVAEVWADPEKAATVLETIIEEGESWDGELEAVRADGSRFYARGTGGLLTDDEGDPLGAVASFIDITERKERERELERQDFLFRRVQDIADIGVWEYDPLTEEITTSDGTRQILGVDDDFDPTLEEALECYHPADRDEITSALEKAIGDGSGFDRELRIVRPDDTSRNVRAFGEVRADTSGNTEVLRGVCQDITEQKEREAKLQRYEFAYNSSLTAVILASLDGEMMDMNPAFLDMWGYDDRDDVVGSSVTAVWKDTEKAATALNTVIEQGRWEGELEAVRTDGSTFFARSTASFLTDEEGDPLGVMGSFVDISERKEYEEELERQNQRLDDFASVLSHDLRNPLNVAQGRLELARETCESDHFEPIESAHQRMESLIENLLTLAREGKTVTDTEAVDLSTILNGCWENVDTKDATIDTDVVQSIQANESRLRQLFENLFRNAVEHGGEDLTVTVGELDDGFYLEDDGKGIPEEDRDQVFEAGYSTSEEGTGFGLNIVNEIVQAHDWEIRVTEGNESGARFEITGVEFTAE